ncbi:hypothetical protein HA402_007546 [Bradysia odoriphaga]|nr:hypothetical protein HA402_007546 [Bradysia odoriphaga]
MHLFITAIASTVCPLNEVYNECGSSCPATCKNYKNPPVCNLMCNAGCECASGYVRNEEDGTCCLESECPATEQEQVCPLNEVYDECGSACPLTCNNYKSPPGVCTANCVVGCRCQDDYVRNEADGTCCLESECPATEEEQVCPLNEVYNECGTSCPITCNNYKNPPQMCNRMCNAGCECAPGYVRNEEDGTCCLESECPATEQEQVCPLNEVYDTCGTACPLTCNNYKSPPDACTDNCVEGCRCQDGYLRNEDDGTCCRESECPASQVCPQNQVYNSCGTACPLTCENYKNPPRFCTKQCVIGCECNKGYVKKSDGSCCLPTECTGKRTWRSLLSTFYRRY